MLDNERENQEGFKSCPFWGCKLMAVECVPPEGETLWWRTMCRNCCARSQMAGTKKQAIENWNERRDEYGSL